MSRGRLARWLPVFALAAPMLHVGEARADEAVVDAPEDAQRAYTSGRESYAAGLYGRALAAFERSFALLPSPNTRLYIARSLRELGRWSEAADALRTTIREAEERGGKYLATRDAATTELDDVVARIERAAPKPAPSAAPVAAAEPPPPPASAPSAEAPRSAPRARAPIGPVTWASTGVAVVAAAASGGLYALGSERYAFLESHCALARDASCDSARTTGRAEETASYVALGVAAVAAVTAVVTFAQGAPAASPRAGRTAWPLRF